LRMLRLAMWVQKCKKMQGRVRNRCAYANALFYAVDGHGQSGDD
jgi:hypothetical protein